MKPSHWSTCVGLAIVSTSSAALEPESVPLFNGEDLSGWAAMFGGSLDAWGVIDGEIRVVNAGRGGWLRTQKMYRDFELTAEFVIPEGGNSGIGLRCSSVGDPAFTGFEVQIADSAPGSTELYNCGAVYNAIRPSTQAFNGPGEWNTYRIRLVGGTLDVWLNEQHVQQAQNLDSRGFFRNEDQPLPLDERLTTGYIAFQDHGEGGLRLRNIMITDLSPDPDPGDYEFAFDGRTTNGWTHRGGGAFRFEDDGDFVALDGPGHLYSDRVHSDIEFHALVRVATPEETGTGRTGNGGIYFRTFPNEGNPDTWPTDHGYEAQIDNHDTRPTHYTGCIYDKAAAITGQPITRDGVWFDYRIRAVGDRVQTFINGRPMVDAELTEVSEGMIAFQTHHPGNRIEFRDVRWRVPTADDLD